MCHIDDRGLAADGQDGALHRADIGIAQAEVGEQRDDRTQHAPILAQRWWRAAGQGRAGLKPAPTCP